MYIYIYISIADFLHPSCKTLSLSMPSIFYVLEFIHVYLTKHCILQIKHKKYMNKSQYVGEGLLLVLKAAAAIIVNLSRLRRRDVYGILSSMGSNYHRPPILWIATVFSDVIFTAWSLTHATTCAWLAMILANQIACLLPLLTCRLHCLHAIILQRPIT